MNHDCRSTVLFSLFVNTVSSSGIVQLGDGDNTDMTSQALAVQRAVANVQKDEFFFESYPLFYLPKLVPGAQVPVRFTSDSPFPVLRVGCIYSLGVSSSSTLRVGCSGPVQGISRIKHIRNFNQPGQEPEI